MKKLFQPEDMKKLTYLSWPSVSPSGSKIAYVSAKGREEDGSFHKTIQIYDVLEKTLRPLEGSDLPMNRDMPEFLPSGHLTYLSDDSGRMQLYIKDMRTRQYRQLTTARHGISNYALNKDGTKAVFELTLWPEDIAEGKAFTEMSQEERDAWEAELDWRPYEIENLTYKMDEWYGMRKGQLPRIGFVDVISGEQKLLYSDEFEGISPVLSPDGEKAAFFGFPHDGAKGRRAELFVIDTRGGERKQLTSLEPYVWADTKPVFADGGRTIIAPYMNMGSSGSEPMKVDAQTGEILLKYNLLSEGKEICHGMNPMVCGHGEVGSKKPHMQLSEDEKTLYFLSSWQGIASIYSLPADGSGQIEVVCKGDTDIQAFSADGGQMAHLMGNLKMPAELFSEGKQLSHSNDWLLDYELPETEIFWIDTKDGSDKLQVWLLHPAGQEEGKKYPAVLDIHGGPECTYNSAFWHEFYALSAAGNAVIYTNPRDSVGYGAKFCTGAFCWSQEAVDDLLAAVDAAVDKGFIDDSRIGVTGGSYGGYMTNKLMIRTDRFAAAVTQRTLINTATSYGTGDMGFISASPNYDKVNMLEYLTDRARGALIGDVDQINIPVLILHATCDYRCGFEQAEQLFVAMKERRPHLPVRLVMFPEENHGMTRNGNMHNQVRHLQEMTDWFKQYLDAEYIKEKKEGGGQHA